MYQYNIYERAHGQTSRSDAVVLPTNRSVRAPIIPKAAASPVCPLVIGQSQNLEFDAFDGLEASTIDQEKWHLTDNDHLLLTIYCMPSWAQTLSQDD